MEALGQRIAHVGHERKVEQFADVEFVFQPPGVRSVVLSYRPRDGPPLRCVVVGRLGHGSVRFIASIHLTPPGSRKRLHAGEDHADHRQDDDQQLDETDEQQPHQARMPPRRISAGSMLTRGNRSAYSGLRIPNRVNPGGRRMASSLALGGPTVPSAPAVVRERSGGESMRAIILAKFGGIDSLVYTEIPKPLPKDGEVVIKVRGFGINHAEMHMRRGEWAEAAEVSGIECVGTVDSCPGGQFLVGAKVAALMGGLGRTINGSYAEYTRVRVSNVALIESELPWSQLAALPETYATAWTCLFRNLDLSEGQTVLIRGATSSFGQAAVKMSVAAGARVVATTRTRERFALLEELDVVRVELEARDLAAHLAEAKQLDAVLDLVGNSTILGSLDVLRRGGTACQVGWLGGLDRIGDFSPLARMASGVNLNFFGSFVFGTPGFPLSDVPLQDIAGQVADGNLEAAPSRVFSFDEIREAHRVMEAGEAGGKMVVVLD